MSTPFKMKGFSGFGNSPMKDRGGEIAAAVAGAGAGLLTTTPSLVPHAMLIATGAVAGAKTSKATDKSLKKEAKTLIKTGRRKTHVPKY